MRIVGGRHKGKKLIRPDTLKIRPTSNRVRESLFNILAHRNFSDLRDDFPEPQKVLDVFAGTGALGFEALSRGAASVCFIDNNKNATRLIRETANLLGEINSVKILLRDATNPGYARETFDLVLMDAPYNTGQSEVSLNALVNSSWLQQGCLCCIELADKEELNINKKFKLIDQRRYGSARIDILRYQPSMNEIA